MKGTTELNDWIIGKNASHPAPVWALASRATDRECEDAFFCGVFKLKKVNVLIQATLDAWQLDLRTVPSNGVLMAKMQVLKNNGTKEKRYQLKPDFVYYLVVEKGPPSTDPIPPATWYVVEVDKNGKQSMQMRSGVFTHCPKDPTGATASDAAFTECSDKLAGAPSHVMVAKLLTQLRNVEDQVRANANGKPTAAQQRTIDSLNVELEHELVNEVAGPAWVSCIHGCCIAQ